MKRFELHRHQDTTGVSGTGRVAQGVVFDDGTCAMRWLSEHRSTAIYESLASLRAIHGHDGRTQVLGLDGLLDDYEAGEQCAIQDLCEGVPWASVGGKSGQKPETFVQMYCRRDWPAWLAGYCSVMERP